MGNHEFCEKVDDRAIIHETCEVCGEKYEGRDDGVSLEGWPDGTFLTPSGPWVCMDCLPDGWKMGVRKSIDDAVKELKEKRNELEL